MTVCFNSIKKFFSPFIGTKLQISGGTPLSTKISHTKKLDNIALSLGFHINIAHH